MGDLKRQERFKGWIAVAGQLIFILGYLFGGLLMIALGTIGFWEAFKGLFVYIGFGSPNPHVGPAISQTAAAIAGALEGFEFLLLAPIPLAIVIAVGEYLETTVAPQQVHAHPHQGSGANLRNAVASDNLSLPTQESLHEALHKYHGVKQLILGLMISVVATDLVKRFLENKLAETDSDIRTVALGIVLFAVLASYLLVRALWIDRGVSRHSVGSLVDSPVPASDQPLPIRLSAEGSRGDNMSP